MPRFIQVFALLLIALAARPVSGFSLLGPLSGSPGGEAWQTVDLGYGLNDDIGTPKNLTEEYRWNLPTITYAFDPSFINYFGTNGIAAVEAAMAVYNSLPDLSTLTQTLDEYPLEDPITGATTTFRDSRRVNFTAQALNLLDMKSMTMGVLAEELGLASPERWMWTLRARATVGPLPVTNYFTIMRNFDPVTYMPSRYVNGNRYTYNIIELDAPFRVYPIEIAADPESALYQYSSVANILGGGEESTTIIPGMYYTYLTRDDIGGLRYIYDRDNLNWESFAPGTQITAPDFTSINLITNQDLTTFSQFTFLNPPAAVLAAFPDLVIRSNSSYLTTEVQVVGTTVTNVRDPWGDPFTTNFMLVPILQTNPVIRYRYSFANVLTNYSSPQTVVRVEQIGFEREPWSTPFNPIYKTNVFDEAVDLPSGGIIIVPTNVGQYTFTGFAFTNVVGITNIIFQTNVVDSGLNRNVQINEIVVFTNVIYGVHPSAVQAAPDSVLRGGVGKFTFQRLAGAIFTGTNFIHTNTYSVTYYTNAFGAPSLITNTFSTVRTAPDILIGAADLGVDTVSPFTLTRTASFVNNGGINSAIENQGGPGNIFSPIQIVFNKVGPGLFNQRPGIATEEAAYSGFGESFIWGSFDGSTNPPVVFPKDITLEDIELLINGGVAP